MNLVRNFQHKNVALKTCVAEQISKEKQKRKASKVFKKMTEQTPSFNEMLEHNVGMKNVQSNEMLFEQPFQLHFQCTDE